jgi:DtxR family transcriptional regulator, Mn-dependent transcriptional regulator
MAHFIHHSEENYLKTLYKLNSKPVKKVNNIALAKELGLNPATVLEMVRKLASRKLVKILTDKTIQLTESGKKNALLIIRKHRLWEVFLTEKLKYGWNEVHELAEQLEHVKSEDLTDRLEAFLDYPAFDPHGDPIPDRNGNIKSKTSVSLSTAVKGKHYVVVNLADTGDSFLDYLGKLNIKPGTKLKLIDHNDYDNSSTVMTQKKQFHLSEKAAKNILVQPS